MKVITVANQKGGVGKTTVATNLAVMYALNGKKTMLVDTDTQGSSMTFRASRPENMAEINAVQITKPTVHRDIASFNADYVIIDAGGRDTAVYRSAIFASDLLVIPVGASPYDVWSTEDTFNFYKEISVTKTFKACVLLNMLPPLGNQKITTEVYDALKDLTETHGIQILDTALCYRVSYKESAIQGIGVAECEGEKHKKAQEEMESLYNEINKILGGIK